MSICMVPAAGFASFLLSSIQMDPKMGSFQRLGEWHAGFLMKLLRELMRMSSTDFILLLMVIFHACHHLLRRQSIGERHLIFFQNWSLRCGLLWYFWHGFDVKNRLCLIVRLGLACTSLSSHERAGLLQAVVSQVEHGILHLADPENPRITVLVGCEGLSPLRFPMQLSRSCSAIFQDHFPDRLGFLFIIRLPLVVRVIVQTFFQVLKTVTQQKLKIEGRTYHKALVDNY